MSLTSEVSLFDISGNEFNNWHSENIWLMPISSVGCYFDISGNDINDIHSLKV